VFEQGKSQNVLDKLAHRMAGQSPVEVAEVFSELLSWRKVGLSASDNGRSGIAAAFKVALVSCIWWMRAAR
jgi:hypothetical protein